MPHNRHLTLPTILTTINETPTLPLPPPKRKTYLTARPTITMPPLPLIHKHCSPFLSGATPSAVVEPTTTHTIMVPVHPCPCQVKHNTTTPIRMFQSKQRGQEKLSRQPWQSRLSTQATSMNTLHHSNKALSRVPEAKTRCRSVMRTTTMRRPFTKRAHPTCRATGENPLRFSALTCLFLTLVICVVSCILRRVRTKLFIYCLVFLPIDSSWTPIEYTFRTMFNLSLKKITHIYIYTFVFRTSRIFLRCEKIPYIHSSSCKCEDLYC